MPKCPKCNAEIDHLRHWAPLERVWNFSVIAKSDGGFLPVYNFRGDTNPGDGEFECPRCREALFTDPDEAADFMRGAMTTEERR